MAWDEVRPESIEQLFMKLQELRGSHYACRGQSDAKWQHLTPTLTRVISTRQTIIRKTSRDEGDPHRWALILEASLIERFRKLAPENLSSTELSMIGSLYLTLSLMQHYGTPTRLLDWTMSPWVAAYFAGEADPVHDGVIWAFNNDALVNEASKQFGKQFKAMSRATVKLMGPPTDATDLRNWIGATREPFDGVSALHIFRDNPRMTSQQSLHTIAGTFNKPHDVLIEEMLPTNQRMKIIIEPNMKAELMQTLAGMNINRYSLFGGAEGVGRMLKDEVHWEQVMVLSNVLSTIFNAWSVD